ARDGRRSLKLSQTICSKADAMEGHRRFAPVKNSTSARQDQGASVRPTRKPKLRNRTSEAAPSRLAERRKSGESNQDPPPRTRPPQSPIIHAEPSSGAPL